MSQPGGGQESEGDEEERTTSRNGTKNLSTGRPPWKNKNRKRKTERKRKKKKRNKIERKKMGYGKKEDRDQLEVREASFANLAGRIRNYSFTKKVTKYLWENLRQTK